jgi:hypothetical protein
MDSRVGASVGVIISTTKGFLSPLISMAISGIWYTTTTGEILLPSLTVIPLLMLTSFGICGNIRDKLRTPIEVETGAQIICAGAEANTLKKVGLFAFKACAWVMKSQITFPGKLPCKT